MIGTESNSEGEVHQSLKQIEGVEEAYSVHGTYNIVAKICTNSRHQLRNIPNQKIGRLEMIRIALIMVVDQNGKAKS